MWISRILVSLNVVWNCSNKHLTTWLLSRMKDNVLGQAVMLMWHLKSLLVRVHNFILVRESLSAFPQVAYDNLLAIADKLAGRLVKSWVRSWLVRLLSTSVVISGHGWLANFLFILFRRWGFECVIRLNCFLALLITIGCQRRWLLFSLHHFRFQIDHWFAPDFNNFVSIIFTVTLLTWILTHVVG